MRGSGESNTISSVKDLSLLFARSDLRTVDTFAVEALEVDIDMTVVDSCAEQDSVKTVEEDGDFGFKKFEESSINDADGSVDVNDVAGSGFDIDSGCGMGSEIITGSCDISCGDSGKTSSFVTNVFGSSESMFYLKKY